MSPAWVLADGALGMLLSLAKGPEEASGNLKFVQGDEGGP